MKNVLTHLTRISSGPVIPEIDGLRFLCIGAVFLVHLNLYFWTKLYNFSSADYRGFVPRLLAQGGWGVELFFVISGFVVSLPFARHALLGASKPSIKRYFLRRVTRLEPPYILNLILFFLLLIVIKGAWVQALLPHLLASATYTHGFVYGEPSAINQVAWSLEIEVQFYMLAPLLTRIFFVRSRTRRRTLLFAAAAVAVTFMYTINVLLMPSRFLVLSVVRFLAYFTMGMILVDIYLVDWQSAPPRSVVWDVWGVGAMVVAAGVCMEGLHPEVIMPFLFLIIACAAFRGRFTSALFRVPLLTIVGGMCYTIYLYHAAVISAVAPHLVSLRALPFAAAVAIATLPLALVTVLGCGILFAVIERPCMDPKWPSKLVAFAAHGFGRRRHLITEE